MGLDPSPPPLLCGVTHSYAVPLIYVCHVSFVCAMTHLCVTLLYVTWRTHLRVIWRDIRDVTHSYGLASTSRLLKIIGLFCRISSLFKGSFAKETYCFKEPTSRSHRICHITHLCVPCLIRVCHDSSTCNMTHSRATWRIHMWHDTHTWHTHT